MLDTLLGLLQNSVTQHSLNVISHFSGTPMSNFLQGASFFDLIRNRGRHSRSPSGVSMTRSLAQSIEDLSSMTISAVSSSKSVEDLTGPDSNMRNRLQSDIPGGRKKLLDLDKNTPKPDKVPSSPTSRIKESVSYETSLWIQIKWNVIFCIDCKFWAKLSPSSGEWYKYENSFLWCVWVGYIMWTFFIFFKNLFLCLRILILICLLKFRIFTNEVSQLFLF